VTHDGRPRLLGPAEHLVRCSRCEAPTIVLCEGEPGAGVLCEGCRRMARCNRRVIPPRQRTRLDIIEDGIALGCLAAVVLALGYATLGTMGVIP
jgi:hypothetical protein